MEWPPASAIPACWQAKRPPSTTSRAISGARVLIGQPRMAIAIIGFPPMAKISLMALVAAMRPKSNGLSTIGIKKSVVLTIDVPLPRS